LLNPDPDRLWFFASGQAPKPEITRHKAEISDVTAVLMAIGPLVRYNDLRHWIVSQTHRSNRTAQLAIAEACRIKSIVQQEGDYRLPT
jgi:hypothetical protein